LSDALPDVLAPGGVLLEQSIRGDVILLNWFCQGCRATWPLTADEYVADRRAETPDRRRVTRIDRRRRA
jgi:hypothetical protein